MTGSENSQTARSRAITERFSRMTRDEPGLVNLETRMNQSNPQGGNVEAAPASTAGFRHRVDVRFMELDSFGIVFHMWYLAYFDDAMIAYFKSRGVSYQQIFIQVVRTELDFDRAVIRRGDSVEIAVRPVRIGRSSFTLEFAVLHADRGDPMVVGRTVYVCVKPIEVGTAKHPIPQPLLDVLQFDLLEADDSG